MTQLSFVHLANRLSHLIEQSKPLNGDCNLDNSPVFATTLTNNQLPLFEPIQHSGGVRSPRNQSLAKRQCLHRRGMNRSQQTKCIVLLSGKLKRTKQLVFQSFQAVVSPPEIQEGFLLR